MTQDNKLKTELERFSRQKLELKINDNHSTMVSVKWGVQATKVSLHRIFLEAPQNVMEALACYISQDHPEVAPSVKAFIHDRLRNIDYTQRRIGAPLQPKGKAYDLTTLFQEIESTYFNQKLPVTVTWFGSKDKLPRYKVTLGLYHHLLKHIKIHRCLDDLSIPKEVVAFTLYHEMLHHICPSEMTKEGKEIVHTEEFKRREKLFKDYDSVQKWIRQFQLL